MGGDINPGYSSCLSRIYRIIECPICSQSFKRTAVLPCAHTFCLACLTKCADAAASDGARTAASVATTAAQVTCPICRKRFELDEGGLANLPRNFVVEGVVETLTGRSSEMNQQYQEELKSCALCQVSELIMDRASVAASGQTLEYCRQCRYNLCVPCATQHKLVFQLHRVGPIGGTSKSNRHLRRRKHAYFCPKHKKDELSFYCFHCSTTTCAVCRHQLHRQHDCPPINHVFEDFVDEMQFELGEVTDFCSTAEHVCKILEKNKDWVNENFSNISQIILHKNALLKNLVDAETNRLLEQLTSITDSRLDRLDQNLLMLKTRLNTLETFVKCYERLKDVATPHDVALRISEFHEKSIMLLDVKVITDAAMAHRSMARIVFENAHLSIDNLLGNISFLNTVKEIKKEETQIFNKIKKFVYNNESIIIVLLIIFIFILSPLKPV